MAGKKHGFTPIPSGTPVSWKYRATRGHGTVVGVHKMGTTAATTEYSLRETDHHVSATGSKEPSIVYHYGSDITVKSTGKNRKYSRAGKAALAAAARRK